LRPVAIALALVFAMGAAGGGAALASQDALPDSPLYRVKLATEDVQVFLTFDEVSKADALIDQSNERVDEMFAMTGNGKDVPPSVLSTLNSRIDRATRILEEHPEATETQARLQNISGSHEDDLVTLWGDIEDAAREDYLSAVATVHNARLPGAGEFVSLRPEDLSNGILTIEGIARQLNPGVWSVGGVEVHVDESTIGGRELRPGTSAAFVIARSASGRLRALSLSPSQLGQPPSGAAVLGEIEAISDDGVTVAGQFISFDSKTLKKGKLKVGQRVQMRVSASGSGVVAARVELVGDDDPVVGSDGTFWFEGAIDGDVTGTDAWLIGGLRFAITPNTQFDLQDGNAQSGVRALVEASTENGAPRAHSIAVIGGETANESVFMVGTFQQSRDGLWTISGLQMAAPERDAEPEAGSVLAIEATRGANGELSAVEATLVQGPNDGELTRWLGTIIAIEGSRWTMELGDVRVDSSADVSGVAVAGDRALVWVRSSTNGTLEATYARVFAQVSAPTPDDL